MALAAGSRIGPYEVVAPLGAGGMGEVYRARDSRLGREVAIKVLPAGLSADPERLKRFEREARSASSLSHPNIVPIFDIGAEGGVSYIAMELVRGKPLRAHLVEGPLPVKRLLQIGAQIAEGLAKAHAAGIVHRDLKPENVMVTEDDHVKILDFGLAKLTQPEGSGSQTMASTVLGESGETAEGMILGTVGYMSPEQATGGSVDYRSDQFSLGSILYEMATGQRAFERASAPQTLAAIIQDDPEPIAALNPRVPAPVRWIIERCLAKEARKRFAATDDLCGDLATVRDRLAEAMSAAQGAEWLTPVQRKRRLGFSVGLVAGLLATLLGVAVWRYVHIDDYWRNPLAGARFTRFTDWEGSESDPSISPDGKFVAFASDRSGPFDVWIGQVGGGQFLNLTSGQGPVTFGTPTREVGFSGDGAHVWYRVQEKESSIVNQIWRVPTLGGPARLFLSNAVEAAWSPDGNQIAYFFIPGDPIFVADKTGGNPRQILAETKGFHNHYLQWSPDGRFIYFVRGIPPEDMDVWRIRSSGGEPERLTTHHGRVGYPTLLNGRTLIYCAPREDGGSGLYAMDTEQRVPRTATSGLEEYTSISASSDGRHLVAAVANPVRNLWTAPISDHVASEADVKPLDLPTVRASGPQYGPDYILYLSSKGGSQGLWRWKGGAETELWSASDGAVSYPPALSADGSQIAFVASSQGRNHLTLMGAEGTGVRHIAESLDVVDAPSWSPDGTWVAVVARDEAGKARPLYRVPADGGPPVRLVDGVNADPVWSPDGHLILYSEVVGGAYHLLKGVTPEGQAVALPEVRVLYLGNRYRFMPGGRAVVIAQSPPEKQRPMLSGDYFLLDLESGHMRQLTSLHPGYMMDSFDVSSDGKTILFDRYRENSDVVLIDLPPR